MRRWLLSLVIFPGFTWGLQDLPQKLFANNNYKETIKALSEKTDGNSLKLLAKAYYKDQEHEKAFQTYLKALDTLPKKAPYQMGKEEEVFYREALQIYLDPHERDPTVVSLKLRDLYAGVLRLHPEYANLGYLIAISYANVDDYIHFFDIFFNSYAEVPDHYLGYKTLGLLHLKLYDRAKTVEDKKFEQEKVISNFKKAKILYPKDPSLYKMEIAFSLDKENSLQVNLKEIINKDIVVPRSDLSFYIDQLLAYGQNELAEEFIIKARKWYPYSRTLDSAKEMLQAKTDANKGK